MINTRTKNKSFINLWHELQNNNYNHPEQILELKNPDLLNVDPYDLSSYEYEEDKIKIKKAIITECKENIWYFFREIVRIPDEMSGEYKPFCIDYNSFIFISLHKQESYLQQTILQEYYDIKREDNLL